MILDVDRQPATAYEHLEKALWPLAKTPTNSKMGYVMFKLQSYITLNHFQPMCIRFSRVLNRQEERSDWNRGHVTHDLQIIFQGIVPIKDCQVTFIYPIDSISYSQLDFHLWLTQLPRKWWIFNWQASWT